MIYENNNDNHRNHEQQHINVRIIPRRNGRNDPERHVLDARRLVQKHGAGDARVGPQPQPPAAADGANLFARRQHFAQTGVHGGFAGIARRDAADFGNVPQNVLLQRPQDQSPLRVGSVPPLPLRRGRLDAQFVHLLGVHGRDLAQILLCGGIVTLDLAFDGVDAALVGCFRGGGTASFRFDSIVLRYRGGQVLQNDIWDRERRVLPQQLQVVRTLSGHPQAADPPPHREGDRRGQSVGRGGIRDQLLFPQRRDRRASSTAHDQKVNNGVQGRRKCTMSCTLFTRRATSARSPTKGRGGRVQKEINDEGRGTTQGKEEAESGSFNFCALHACRCLLSPALVWETKMTEDAWRYSSDTFRRYHDVYFNLRHSRVSFITAIT